MDRSTLRLLAVAAVAVLALASTTPGTGAEKSSPFDAQERQRLTRGETVVRWEAGTVTAARRLEAQPERVFRAVGDFGHYHEFMPFLLESEVLRSRSLSATATESEVRQVLAPPFPLRRRECRVTMLSQAPDPARGPDRRWHARWRLIPDSGDVVRHEGEWIVSGDGEGGSLVVFRWRYDPGGSMPRAAIDRGMERSVPWVLDGLRQQVRRCRYDAPPPPGCNNG